MVCVAAVRIQPVSHYLSCSSLCFCVRNHLSGVAVVLKYSTGHICCTFHFGCCSFFMGQISGNGLSFRSLFTWLSVHLSECILHLCFVFFLVNLLFVAFFIAESYGFEMAMVKRTFHLEYFCHQKLRI